MKVELIDSMGSDLSVVNAARVSFHKESTLNPYEELQSKDVKLLHYLAKHDHWTPFAHTCLSFRIQAPIFVARQLGKHQVGLVWNEVSRRYVKDTPEFHVPETWRKAADNVKQGSLDEPIDESVSGPMSLYNRQCLKMYLFLLEKGVCPEQARMVLPQSMLTEWIWTGNFYSFASMCEKRMKKDTQKETREIAEQIHKELMNKFPRSMEAFTERT